MKTISKKIGLGIALLLFLFCSCKKPMDGVNINVNTESLKSPMMLKFVNAKLMATNQPKNFNITIGGQNPGFVFAGDGTKATKVNNGILELALDKSANPTPSNPIKFTVTANAPGFAPTTTNIIVTDVDKPEVIVINLAEYANMPSGTSLSNSTKTISNGTATTELVLTTPTSAGMTEKTKITIPTGTSFLDADGKVIIANKLTAKVIHYGTTSEESLSAFPGGFYADNAIGADGLPINGGVFFKTAGFLAIDLVAGDKEVKGFTKPVDIEMEIENTLINPTTGLQVKENETIPLWSLNNETGQWRNEGTASFVKNSVGKLIAKAQISHLSYWNFDWYWGSCNGGANRGTITINAPQYSSSEFYKLVAVTADRSYSYTKQIYVPNGTNRVNSVYNLPNIEGKFEIYNMSGKLLAESQIYPTLCGQNTVFKLPESTPPSIVNVSLNLKVKCSGKSLATGFNGYAYIYEINNYWWNYKFLYVQNGNVQSVFKTGAQYYIYVYRDRQWYSTQFIFETKDFILPTQYNITGTATYNQATKNLSVNALYVSPNCK